MNIDKSNKTRGVYRRFRVERVDGRSEPGEKHHGCDYWVLDLDHDPYALPALKAYAQACQAEYPVLALDLWGRIGDMEQVLREAADAPTEKETT